MSATPLHSGNVVIDTLFQICVEFLMWLGGVFGVSYFTVNIVIFCILWPLFTLSLLIIVIRQRRIIRKLKAGPQDLPRR